MREVYLKKQKNKKNIHNLCSLRPEVSVTVCVFNLGGLTGSKNGKECVKVEYSV